LTVRPHRRLRPRTYFWCVLLLAASALSIPTARSEGEAPLLDAPDLAAYLDGLVPFALAKGDIAGGEITVVAAGHIVFSKGYGFADVRSRTPISAPATIFRVGSISKLFTWTALMQQIERGRVSLDADVNDYLDFRIPPAFGKPITIRDLMTHTAGFEESFKDIYFREPHSLLPIGDYLKTHHPARIFPPGTVIAYSNYGATLAGYIVERTSGMPFDEYAERNILEPLGMSHSSFRQPLPAALRPLLSSGYQSANTPPLASYELIQVSPAGALASSGGDLAKFVIAHLNDGAYGDVRILQRETARLMHSRQISAAPGLNGMALGFYEASRNGHRVISHAGDTDFYHNDLYLILDEGVGIIMNFNTAGDAAEQLSKAVFEGLMERYFPSRHQQQPTYSGAVADGRAVAGNYITSRRVETTFMRLTNVIVPFPVQFAVSSDSDGTLEVPILAGIDGLPLRWREVGPLLYEQVGGSDRLSFVRDSSGRIDHFASDADIPVYESQAVPWSENLAWVRPLAWSMTSVFVVVLIGGPGVALVRRRRGIRPTVTRKRWILRSLYFACPLNLAIFLGWYQIISAPRISPLMSSALDLWLAILYAAGWLSLVVASLAVYRALQLSRDPVAKRSHKIAHSMLALVMVCFGWMLISFHLIDFKFGF
jgi:CubicO group peptidase (beta-lactamase class C family)